MEQIGAAINNHDATALKDMFSPYALEGATSIDEGLDYLLSFFPDGGVTWKQNTIDSSGSRGYGSEVLLAVYKASADGKDYWLFFADFTINDHINPDNVGIYGLGVSPWTDDPHVGDSEQFFDWAGAIRLETNLTAGYPGVFVPSDDYVSPTLQTEALMEQIATAINNQDAASLKALFSPRAREEATDLDQSVQALLSLFPGGGMTWDRPGTNTSSDDAAKVFILKNAEYKLSAGGEDYWWFFAYYALDTTNPDNVGLAVLAVTPWSEPGSPTKDEAFDDLTNSWIADDTGPTGIYVPNN